jgi:hypothetical protein
MDAPESLAYDDNISMSSLGSASIDLSNFSMPPTLSPGACGEIVCVWVTCYICIVSCAHVHEYIHAHLNTYLQRVLAPIVG